MSSQRMHSPQENTAIKRVQAENMILKEENDLLRKELKEIKQILLKGDGRKQEEMNNLRQTIKKEDTENKELKLQLEIQVKKAQAIETLLTTKQHEIEILTHQLEHTHKALEQERSTNSIKMLQLREKVLAVSETCCAMEERNLEQEREWNHWKENWMHEKQMYMHRI